MMKKFLFWSLIFGLLPTYVWAYDNNQIALKAMDCIGCTGIECDCKCNIDNQITDTKIVAQDQTKCSTDTKVDCYRYIMEEGVCLYVEYKQCKNFVQYVLGQLKTDYNGEGLTLGSGYTQKGYIDSGAREVNPTAAKMGDVIQTSCDAMDSTDIVGDEYLDDGCNGLNSHCWPEYRQYCYGYHTAIIIDTVSVASNGDYIFRVVDSNYSLDCVVKTHDWNPYKVTRANYGYAKQDDRDDAKYESGKQYSYCGGCSSLSVHIYRFGDDPVYRFHPAGTLIRIASIGDIYMVMKSSATERVAKKFPNWPVYLSWGYGEWPENAYVDVSDQEMKLYQIESEPFYFRPGTFLYCQEFAAYYFSDIYQGKSVLRLIKKNADVEYLKKYLKVLEISRKDIVGEGIDEHYSFELNNNYKNSGYDPNPAYWFPQGLLIQQIDTPHIYEYGGYNNPNLFHVPTWNIYLLNYRKPDNWLPVPESFVSYYAKSADPNNARKRGIISSNLIKYNNNFWIIGEGAKRRQFADEKLVKMLGYHLLNFKEVNPEDILYNSEGMDIAADGVVDSDLDQIVDSLDECPLDYQNDEDVDGICYSQDNCPSVSNHNQQDSDQDKIGDACDNNYNLDSDGDKIEDGVDNCPYSPNSTQIDGNNNGIGDVCDDDGEGANDDCPPVKSPEINSSKCIAADTLYLAVCVPVEYLSTLTMIDIRSHELFGATSWGSIQPLVNCAVDFSHGCLECMGQEDPSKYLWNAVFSSAGKEYWFYAEYPPGKTIGTVKVYYGKNPINVVIKDNGKNGNNGEIILSNSNDLDEDKIKDLSDNCPDVFNHEQQDGDDDGVGDICDNCPLVQNSDQDSSACLTKETLLIEVCVPTEYQGKVAMIDIRSHELFGAIEWGSVARYAHCSIDLGIGCMECLGVEEPGTYLWNAVFESGGQEYWFYGWYPTGSSIGEIRVEYGSYTIPVMAIPNGLSGYNAQISLY